MKVKQQKNGDKYVTLVSTLLEILETSQGGNGRRKGGKGVSTLLEILAAAFT